MTGDRLPASVPPDALVLLVGPSGAGKSTWAARELPAGAVLSSDAFRQLVAGDAADQAATADAFKTLHLVAQARLRRGLLTAIDATNLSERARGTLAGLATRWRRPVVAVAFDVPLERCLARNAARPDRQVPDEVVRRHHREMQAALARLPEEGYAQVLVLREHGLEGG